MRVLVMLNAAAGTLVGSSKHDEPTVIRERFEAAGASVDVREVPGEDLSRVATEARNSGDYDLIVAGGGDGTLNTIATALVGGDVPFGILPLGTFNHLAKELEIPLVLNDAIDALVNGRTVPFNVGRVNDRCFLLFAAIGLYSDMVKHRDAQRKTLGRPKMWAGTIAAMKMIFRWPLLRVAIRHDASRSPLRRMTPVVYVSLSGYQIDQMGVAGRPKDVRAKLNVFVAAVQRRTGLLWLIARSVVGRVRARQDVELIRTEACEVAMHRRRHVRVGYDGEVETMQTPLRFELLRGALKMRVPANASRYVLDPEGKPHPGKAATVERRDPHSEPQHAAL